MKTKNTPIQMFQVEPICTECDKGTYVATGLCLTVNPPKYNHACNACGHTTSFYKSYPSTGYRATDEPTISELTKQQEQNL